VANIDPTSISGDYSTFLTKDVGVTSIPLRAFYRKEDASKVEKYVRFAFCKDEATLEEGARRLEKYFLK
jgi:aspartate/methionine/tyrosine aminotransferase